MSWQRIGLGGGLAAAVSAGLLALIWGAQRRLIYFPDPRPPSRAVFPEAESVVLVTADGIELSGWYLPASAQQAPAGPCTPLAATVLVLNGNAGNRGDRVDLARALGRRGLSVLLFDYRGYGGNPGRPSEAGLIADGRAARDWLEERTGGAPLVLFGESLGAAVAVALAAERAPTALVLRSPFLSLVEIGRLHYPWLPVRWLLCDRFPSIERIRDVHCPLLVLAGDLDGIVPYEHSTALYRAAPSPHKRLVTIEGADHNDRRLVAGERCLEALDGFVNDSLAARRELPVFATEDR